MRLPRITLRKWMIVVAVTGGSAWVCAGLLAVENPALRNGTLAGLSSKFLISAVVIWVVVRTLKAVTDEV